jgi:hypothetical protein
VDYGDGSGVQTLVLNDDKTFSLSHTYADDNVYMVEVKVTNDDGAFGSGYTTVTVNNVAPTLGLSGDASVYAGDTYTLSLSSSDPGTDTITSWSINWGDVVEPVTDNPASVTHVYADGPHDYTISATATDEDGTFNAGNTVAVHVALRSFTISLVPGWNLISTPFAPDETNNDPSEFFAPLGEDMEIAWKYNPANPEQPWEYYIPSLPEYSTMTTIDEKSGYYVYMYDSADIVVYGVPADVSIPLYSGWNLIGYPSLSSSTPGTVYDGLNYEIVWGYDRYNQENPWHYYIPSIEYGDLAIEPGNGYYIYMYENDELAMA